MKKAPAKTTKTAKASKKAGAGKTVEKKVCICFMFIDDIIHDAVIEDSSKGSCDEGDQDEVRIEAASKEGMLLSPFVLGDCL